MKWIFGTGMLFVAAAAYAEMPAVPEASVSSQTISASAVIDPGRYVTTVTPDFNRGMAKRIESAVKAVPGLKNVKAEPSTSSLFFTVQDGSQARLADIQQAVKQTNNNGVITTPVMQGTLTPKPGL